VVENLAQQALCTVEHAKIVERPPATQSGTRQRDLKACAFKHFNGGLGRPGQKITIEGVWPEQNFLAGLSGAVCARTSF